MGAQLGGGTFEHRPQVINCSKCTGSFHTVKALRQHHAEDHAKKLLREEKAHKPDFSIIPYEALEELAYQFMDGATKYERDNYKNATVDQIQTYRESLLRHNLQYQDGQTDEKHLRAVMCNAAIIMFLEKKYGVYE